MLVRGFSTVAVLAMNLAVIAILVCFVYFLRWAGTEFCLGLSAGFAICYILFRCWRFDFAEPTEPAEPSRPQPPQR
jgi:hypothetical protein